MSKFLKIAGFSLILKIMLSIIFLIYLDNLLKKGFENFETEELGVKVTIDKFSISIFTGTINIKNFNIYNPHGFISNVALNIDTISVKFNLLSLFTDAIEINKLKMSMPIFNLSVNKHGVKNLDFLKTFIFNKNIPTHIKYEDRSIFDYINGNAIKKQNFIINKLVVSKLLLKQDNESPKSFLYDDYNLENIGFKEHGLSIPALTKYIIHDLLKQVSH